jgi:hypothetical protein
MAESSRQTYLERARATLAAREAWQSVFVPVTGSENGTPLETTETRDLFRARDNISSSTDEIFSCDQSDKSDTRFVVDEREDQELGWRIETMRQQIRPGRSFPFLVARHSLVDAPGHCLSCGDPHGPERRFRCGPCARAAESVVNEAWEGRQPAVNHGHEGA